MPAAVLENTPQEDFGRNLANRKCSERFAVSRSLHQRPGKAEGKRKASARSGTEGPERQGGEAVTEPPGGRERSQDRNQPPDGTGRQHGNQAMKAGPSRTTEQPKARKSSRKDRTKQLESSLGYGDRPSRPEPEQASVGLVETPAPFALGGLVRRASADELASTLAHSRSRRTFGTLGKAAGAIIALGMRNLTQCQQRT